jgi:hypothetical protein
MSIEPSLDRLPVKALDLISENFVDDYYLFIWQAIGI